jgi:dTDP-glucose 4,6-dehydratase
LEKVIPRFVTSVLLNEKLRVHGNGNSARDFVFVEDNCRAIDMVLHAPEDKVVGEVFNVGSSEHRTIGSIANDITSMMSHENNNCITYVGDRPGQVIRHTADCSKISEKIGWKPETGWRKGLEMTIEWYKNNSKWWEKQLWMRDIPIISASGKNELH